MNVSMKRPESSLSSEVPYSSSDAANSPLCAFFYEVNRIRQGQDKRRDRSSINGSPNLLNSSYGLSKKELSDIKAAAFFNRCYAGTRSTENLNRNSGICVRKNASFSKNVLDSVDMIDDALSIKTSLSDYKISNKDNVCKIIDSPLKAPTIHNVEYSTSSSNSSYLKEHKEPSVNIFKDENHEDKSTETKKSALRSISLNIKDIVSSIVSNVDDHKQFTEHNNDVKKLGSKPDNSYNSSVSQVENNSETVSMYNKNNMYSGFFSRCESSMNKNNVKEMTLSNAEETELEVSSENEKKNQSDKVHVNTFSDLEDNCSILEDSDSVYSNNTALGSFNSDVYNDKVNSIQNLTYSTENSSTNLKADKSSFSSLPKLYIAETGSLGLEEFMVGNYLNESAGGNNSLRKSSVLIKKNNKLTKETSESKSSFFEENSVLDQEKLNNCTAKVQEMLYNISNDTPNLLKTELHSGIGHSDIKKDNSNTRILSNSNVDFTSKKASCNTHVKTNGAVTLPILEDQFLSDFDPSLNDVSNAIDKVIGVKKRGYIMRQNAEIVHASSEDNFDENYEKETVDYFKLNSVHEKQEKNPTYKSEKTMNTNVKYSQDISVDKKANASLLFVRVLGVKNLELLLPENESLRFCCTLDNNKHYVTTPWMPLSKNAKIDEEFELIAYDGLEFTFTLRVDYEPKAICMKKKSIFSRISKSSKKQELLDLSDPLANSLSNNGSFGRSYVSLKMLKDNAYGRSYMTTIPCMNEWTKKVVAKGKNRQLLKVKPYIICQLKIMAFYVPFVPEQPKGTLPKSMSACIKDIKNAEWICKLNYEGLLIQHGGDCLYRKKRYFCLTGLKLTSYHESTRSVRSNINLVKAVSVLDDQQLCINSKPSTDTKDVKNGYSVLLESDGDYMFIKGGFCIKFMNGEVINFYAESEDEKIRWVRVLNAAIKKANEVKPWSLYVIYKQKAMKRVMPKPVLKTETSRKLK
ncbi:unnamed protein product [Pneumocystis jirovecii]|uniref:PH domain-containing protein n=1 Tax=Pneumocystis jirovecii TaxID=42068 RepID=L0PEG5_PNEJI|nr:unnamed protein product [Pneumocystis jirovecii]